MSEETARLCATAKMESFAFSIWSSDGTVEKETVMYRNLGKNGRANSAEFRELQPHQMLQQPAGPDGTTLRIMLPAPLKRHDHIEISRTRHLRNAFPAAVEGCSKRIVFPVRLLTITIEFEGSNIDNVIGERYSAGIPAEGGFAPLKTNREGNILVVKWDVDDAKPAEKYAVSWKWV